MRNLWYWCPVELVHLNYEKFMVLVPGRISALKLREIDGIDARSNLCIGIDARSNSVKK